MVLVPTTDEGVQYGFDGIMSHASRVVTCAAPPLENNLTPTLSVRRPHGMHLHTRLPLIAPPIVSLTFPFVPPCGRASASL